MDFESAPDVRTSRDDDTDWAPAAPSQRRLWALARSAAGSGGATAVHDAVYNLAMAFELRGPLDRAALRTALDALLDRHEALRTTLVAVDGDVAQRIAPPGAGFPLPDVDLVGRPDADDELAAARRAEVLTPFDLGRGPLARGRLVRLAADRHVLLLTVHHTVFDGTSRTVFLRELGTLYGATAAGSDVVLPPLTTRFRDHAQRALITSAPDGHVEFWREALEGAPATTTLPPDRPRPAEQDHSGGQVEIHVDAATTAAVKALAEEQRVSVYTVVLTAWALVLARLGRTDDVVVGVPTAGRGRAADDAFAGVVGFFVNTVAVRVGLTGDPTAAELLQRTRVALRAAITHQDLPLDRVVEAVNPPRTSAHPPLFQTFCALIPTMRGLLRMPGLEVAWLPVRDAAATLDLALAVCDEGDHLSGYLDYATALYDEPTARRVVGHLGRVLAGLVAAPDRPVGDIELMDPAERARVLAWSTGPDPVRRPGGVVARWRARLAEDPDAPAVAGPHGSLTRRELGSRSDRLASALRDRGVGRDCVVGLHLGTTPELVVAVLAVLSAGAAWLPLDPDQPAARLAAMVSDARPALVLSDADDAPDGWRAPDAVAAGAPDGAGVEAPSADDGDAAYVIYTSGSTGRPKGVVVTHSSVLNLLDQWTDRFGTTPGEATSVWSSIGFDASVHELLLPLTTGAVAHLVPAPLRGDPAALMAWLREHRVVQAFLPPAYVRWIDEDSTARLAGLALRQLLTGVESLPQAALARMRAALPGLRICFGYGPTEATLYSIATVDPEPPSDGGDRPCPIGRPLPGTRAYLLDDRGLLVPPGAVGEIHLAGASLARGYLGPPELTDERFLPDPFMPGERVYRTGDLARWLPDGTAEYVGRRDDQVKLRGYRIEPGEVAAALRGLPGVRDAAVLLDHGVDGAPRLVAGVAVGSGTSGRDHRAELADLLPGYMIPAVVVELAELPLGRAGKLDRDALLREVHAVADAARVNTTTPRDRVELAVLRAWQRVLLHPELGIDDDFFAVGGTSVSAIRLATELELELGVPVPVSEVLRRPTVETMAARLRTGGSAEEPDGPLELRAGVTGGPRVLCVHPAGGTAFCYLPLAAALPDGVAVHGVESVGLRPGETPLPSVEAMAADHLDRAAIRVGAPVVLCGLSFGGLVAHEMGRQLTLAGHRDVTVVLLDTQGTGGDIDTTEVDLAEFRDKLVRFNGMYPGIDDDQIERYHRIYNHNRAVAQAYRPQRTDAATVLLQAVGGDDEPGGVSPAEYWAERAGGGFDVRPVDCGHWDMLESATLPLVVTAVEESLAPQAVRR
ncbi:amino acid adenylation domain-containing protein [Umezawaea sp. Da 62-37]|uniref:non-ribosomal peptide synthetase n=1 Tax=Umezawaea sp. Da 62-37 TaxID=3075927 RepID=UPI0028F7359E|nr:amino acid adenylation domain-containing protein [Umezawaea sp. Da 62-37]WNV88970.1 amino acid adenylation domain-containing protein [Umezawaea sp. Da 62-37]